MSTYKNKNFGQALGHSIDGIKYTFKNERNLKIQSVFAILAIICGVVFKLSLIEFAILFFIIGIVFFAELINSTIELVLDIYSEEYNEKIKCAKDIASGAVLVTSITSIIIGCILFVPKIVN